MTSALWRRGGLPNMTMGSCLKTLPNAGWSYEPEILWTSHVVAPDDVVLRPTSSLPPSLLGPIYLKVNSVLHRQSVRPDVAPSHYRDERPTDRGPSESETAAGTGMGPPPHFTYGYGRPPFLCTRVEEDICGGIYSAHDYMSMISLDLAGILRFTERRLCKDFILEESR